MSETRVINMDKEPLPWWATHPADPAADITFVYRKGMMLMLIEDRRYRLTLPTVASSAPVVLMAWRDTAHFHLDRLSLSDEAARQDFIADAARECGYSAATLADDLQHLANALTRYRDQLFSLQASERDDAVRLH